VVVVSESAAAVEAELEIGQVVESRSQWADEVHRPDPDADDPRPACPQADADDHDDYRQVAYVAVASHRGLCNNPECFGGDWR
jgi:hypothetical protein